MNPFIENALRRLVPLALGMVGTWLVTEGLLSPNQAEQFIGLLTTIIVAGALSVFQTYRSRQEKLTGLALPHGSTEADAKKAVENGRAPDVSTSVHEVPVLQPANK